MTTKSEIIEILECVLPKSTFKIDKRIKFMKKIIQNIFISDINRCFIKIKIQFKYNRLSSRNFSLLSLFFHFYLILLFVKIV